MINIEFDKMNEDIEYERIKEENHKYLVVFQSFLEGRGISERTIESNIKE